MSEQTIADAKAEARAIVEAAMLRAREVTEIASERAFELTQGAYERERAHERLGKRALEGELARQVAEALLAWRRDPNPRTWDAVFDRLRDYQKAAKP